MTVTEYIKKEITNLKERPPKERWEYFWDYYKWYILVFVLVLALLVQGIVGVCIRKDVIFHGFLINCKINVQDKDFLQGFYDYADIDGKSKQAAMYSDMILTTGTTKTDINTFQRMMAGISVKEGDFVVADPTAFQLCAYSTGRIFIDLRTFLDTDSLEKIASRLYYIDGALLDKLDAPLGETPDPNTLVYPDPHKPETMENPIPIGIDISDRKAFQSAYYYDDTTLYLGVIANTPRIELIKLFLGYLWS